MDERQPGDTNETESTKERRLPPRLREIAALANRLRILLADADAGSHAPIREVYRTERGFDDPEKRGTPNLERVMLPEWHDTFIVVITRLRKVLHLGAGGHDEFRFYSGTDIETRWMGDGEALAQARRMLKIAEILVSDYHATSS